MRKFSVIATTWHLLSAEDVTRHIPCSACDCAADATWCETRRIWPNGAIAPSLGFYYFCAAHGPIAPAVICPAALLSFAADDAPPVDIDAFIAREQRRCCDCGGPLAPEDAGIQCGHCAEWEAALNTDY